MAEQLSFLPPPPLNATLPAAGTQADTLLQILLTGSRVAQPEWLDLTGSWRLAASAQVLKDLQWPMESDRQPAPTEGAPQRSISLYWLPEWAVIAGRELLRNARGER